MTQIGQNHFLNFFYKTPITEKFIVGKTIGMVNDHSECFLIVVPRGQSSLSQHSNHPGGDQARSTRRQRNSRETEREKVGSHHIPSRPRYGQGNQRCQISRVLCTDAKGS